MLTDNDLKLELIEWILNINDIELLKKLLEIKQNYELSSDSKFLILSYLFIFCSLFF
jgi:uncharacterized membrane protein YqhA